MSKHANISIFVPHLGCNNRCSFCNQNSITGQMVQPTADDVINSCLKAVKSKNYNADNTEIAFFGGSFTAIDRGYMISLLKTAYSFVEKGLVKGIRISTRPDAINEEILDILKLYGVTAIEIGAQSMVDSVLSANFRGHTAEDVVQSANLIKSKGFELGLQMMTGLYKSSVEYDMYTAKSIVNLRPATVRVYPTIVLKNTLLAKYYGEGKYSVQTLEDAVKECAELLMLFLENNINVIRLGLHTINEEDYVAGPWHQSFKDLCDGEILLNKAKNILTKLQKGKFVLFVNSRCLSSMIGQKKINISKLKLLGYDCEVKCDNTLKEYEVKAEKAVES